MILSLAPMEGVTGHVFRRVHAECFGPLDRYYTPFVAPPQVGKGFVGRAKKELDPVANEGLDVVPQLLTRDADRFVGTAGLLQQMGYREVNLNAGCPSGTVVSKGKGAGFLQEPRELEAFLRDPCARGRPCRSRSRQHRREGRRVRRGSWPPAAVTWRADRAPGCG